MKKDGKTLSQRIDEFPGEAMRISCLLKTLRSHAGQYGGGIAHCKEDRPLLNALAEIDMILEDIILPKMESLEDNLIDISAECIQLENAVKKEEPQAAGKEI